MALDYSVVRKVKGNPSGEVAPGRRLKLDPGRDFTYDMPKELIAAVLEKFPADSLRIPEGKQPGEFFSELGQGFMEVLIELADSDAYRDRTAEVIEQVAQQTGIRFPHSFERYLELAILTLRPRDAWTVTEATTRCLKLRSFSCGINKTLGTQGVQECSTLCREMAETAAKRVGINVEFAQTKDFPKDGLCELTINNIKGC